MNPASLQTGMALFPTALGYCGIAWRADRVVATHLPEDSKALTLARLVSRAGGAREALPSPVIQSAISGITRLLDDGSEDLSFIDCDFGEIEPLQAEIYRITRAILPGQTLTYGEIAVQLGNKRLAQPVGQALGRNPLPIIVPCHRVMGANGKLTGFSANGGVSTKLRMLGIEGARIGDGPTLFERLPLATKPSR